VQSLIYLNSIRRSYRSAGLHAFFLGFSITQRDAICRCLSSTRTGMAGLKVAVGPRCTAILRSNTGPLLAGLV
jgi:hypothetical protein